MRNVTSSTSTITNPPSTAPSTWLNVKVGNDTNNADQDEPSIAVNPTNQSNVIVGLHDFGVSNTQPVSAYASQDGGHTWNGPFGMPVPVSGEYTSDPVVAFNSSGVAFFSYLAIHSNLGTSDLVVSISTNRGLSWSAPVVAVRGIPGFSFIDKDYMAIGRDPAVPTRDNIYVTYTNFTGTYNSRIEVARSTNGGKSWSSSLPVSPQTSYPRVVQGSMPAVAPNGAVYVAYYDSTTSGYLYGAQEEKIAVSVDGGQTFSAPILIAHMPKQLPFRIWPNYFRAASSMFPSITVGPEGNVYAVFASNPPGPDVSDIYFTRSTNGGSAWSTPVAIGDDGSIQSEFFPWVAAEKDGTVLVIFGDHRQDAMNVAYDIYDAVSLDRGVTWGFNKRVTSVSGNPSYNYFIGDYFNLAVSNTTAYAVWTDERNYPGQSNDVFVGIGDLTTNTTRTHDPGVSIAGNEPYDCSVARNAGSGGTFSGNTGYSDDSFSLNPYNGTGIGWMSPDVVYKFTISTTGTYIVNAYNSFFYPSLQVRAVCNDPTSLLNATGQFSTQIVLPNLKPGTYYVILDGYFTQSFGPYTLNIIKLPPAVLTASPDSVSPGSIVSLKGQGFIPFVPVTFSLNGLPLGGVYSDTLGNVTFGFVVPSLIGGFYKLTSTDYYGISASTTLTVFEISSLQILVNTTLSTKSGKGAEFYVLTLAKGIRVNATLTSAHLYGPGGKSIGDLLGTATNISTGLYHLSWYVQPWRISGVYSLVVNASYISSTEHFNGSSLTLFNVLGVSTVTSVQTLILGISIAGIAGIKLHRRKTPNSCAHRLAPANSLG